jgi:hypothetical protein
MSARSRVSTPAPKGHSGQLAPSTDERKDDLATCPPKAAHEKEAAKKKSWFKKPTLRFGSEWQKSLAEHLESHHMNALVILLILVDLGCTTLLLILEKTDLLNPKYKKEGKIVEEWAKSVCILVLSTLLIEQLLRIAAFGAKYLEQTFMVMDLVIVSVSLWCEIVVEDFLEGREDFVRLIAALQLWKAFAFTFDLCLAIHERHENEEKIIEEAIHKHSKAHAD